MLCYYITVCYTIIELSDNNNMLCYYITVCYTIIELYVMLFLLDALDFGCQTFRG